MRIRSPKTLRWTLLAACGLLVLSLLVSATQELPPSNPELRSTLEWVGAIHVHTIASDGGGTVEEVVEAAANAELDFVTVTDHNRWGAPTPEYLSGVLVVVGEEARVPAGHMLVLGGQHPSLRRERRSNAEAAGTPLGPSVPAGAGLRVAAHPEGPSTRWSAWGETDLDALEVWNWDTDLRNDRLWEWPGALLTLPWKPTLAYLRLVDRPDLTLARWDSLLAIGRVLPTVCAVDAHANVRLGPVRLALPAYEDLFRLARQHVILHTTPTGDPQRDAVLVTRALREGRSYCAIDAVADGSGLTVAAGNGVTTVGLGGTLQLDSATTLSASLPREVSSTEFVLYHNGIEIDRASGTRSASHTVRVPGVYRFEIVMRRAGRTIPWILANPIRVLPPEEAAENR